PVSKITSDFLGYMNSMERLNIELASEFIVVAATLMRIKTKMLLPRKELNEAGEEIDPREELVQRLMEYKRFKGVISELAALEEDRRKRFASGDLGAELRQFSEQVMIESECESVVLYRLLQLLRQAMELFE